MAAEAKHAWDTPEWAALAAHKATIDGTHLRDLMEDADRVAALNASFDGIRLDYSRQRVTQETMDKLFALAEATGVKDGLVRFMRAGVSASLAGYTSALALACPPTTVVHRTSHPLHVSCYRPPLSTGGHG